MDSSSGLATSESSFKNGAFSFPHRVRVEVGVHLGAQIRAFPFPGLLLPAISLEEIIEIHLRGDLWINRTVVGLREAVHEVEQPEPRFAIAAVSVLDLELELEVIPERRSTPAKNPVEAPAPPNRVPYQG